MSNCFCAGIPAVIVGCVAAVRPSTFDLRAPLTMDIMCGSLTFTSTVNRTRYLIYEDINRYSLALRSLVHRPYLQNNTNNNKQSEAVHHPL